MHTIGILGRIRSWLETALVLLLLTSILATVILAAPQALARKPYALPSYIVTVKLSVPIKVDTQAQVMSGIESTLE